jgi:hypothetical protein
MNLNHLSRRYLYPMSIAALFTIAKVWNQLTSLSMEELIKKMWHTYTIEYLLCSHKNNKILPFVKTCVNLQDILLNEKN